MKKWYFPVSDLNESRRIRKSIKLRKRLIFLFVLALLDQKIGNWGERKFFKKRGLGKSLIRLILPSKGLIEAPRLFFLKVKNEKAKAVFGGSLREVFNQTLITLRPGPPAPDVSYIRLRRMDHWYRRRGARRRRVWVPQAGLLASLRSAGRTIGKPNAPYWKSNATLR